MKVCYFRYENLKRRWEASFRFQQATSHGIRETKGLKS